VIGGGDSFMEEATFLTKYDLKVGRIRSVVEVLEMGRI